MKFIKKPLLVIVTSLLFISCSKKINQNKNINSENMMIRMSEIEIDSKFLSEYISILREEAEASVRIEKGVVALYPMFQKEKPNEIRILEIYADKESYQAHLQTPHFKHYKASTLNMVKSLKLIDMQAIDRQTMSNIFAKLEE